MPHPPPLPPTLDLLTAEQQRAAARVQSLQAAVRLATRTLPAVSARRRYLFLKGKYASVVYAFRCKVDRLLGFRIGGVLIGATAVGALALVTAYNWLAGAIGLGLGAAVLAFLLFVPSDTTLTRLATDVQMTLPSVVAEHVQAQEQLRRVSAELLDAEQQYRRLAAAVEQERRRQSAEFRRRQLLGRNWKAMRSVDFESFLEEVFKELGYCVQTTAITGDQGADLIVAKAGCRIAIQVKGYVHSVSNSAVQEAFTSKGYYKCQACAVITNSRFTASAVDVAGKVGCVLIDEDSLPRLVLGEIDLWEEARKKGDRRAY